MAAAITATSLVVILLSAVPALATPVLFGGISGTGNHYDFIITNGGAIDTTLTWNAARTAAQGMTFMGVSGQLHPLGARPPN